MLCVSILYDVSSVSRLTLRRAKAKGRSRVPFSPSPFGGSTLSSTTCVCRFTVLGSTALSGPAAYSLLLPVRHRSNVSKLGSWGLVVQLVWPKVVVHLAQYCVSAQASLARLFEQNEPHECSEYTYTIHHSGGKGKAGAQGSHSLAVVGILVSTASSLDVEGHVRRPLSTAAFTIVPLPSYFLPFVCEGVPLRWTVLPFLSSGFFPLRRAFWTRAACRSAPS